MDKKEFTRKEVIALINKAGNAHGAFLYTTNGKFVLTPKFIKENLNPFSVEKTLQLINKELKKHLQDAANRAMVEELGLRNSLKATAQHFKQLPKSKVKKIKKESDKNKGDGPTIDQMIKNLNKLK